MTKTFGTFHRKLSWKRFDNETKRLANNIRTVGFQPDIIIGIIRGGLVPARLIAKYLNVKKIHVIQIQKTGKKRKVIGETQFNPKGKKVLLIEDLLETGKSLTVAKQYLAKKGAKVKTAAYYFLPQSEIVPNFFLSPLNKKVQFPWE